jgi:hypothetical protein
LGTGSEQTMTPEQKKNNRRLGLILASVAIVFFLGFMAKLVFLGKG